MKFILIIPILALAISCNTRLKEKPISETPAYKSNGTRVSLYSSSYSLGYLSDWTIDSTQKIKNVESHIILHSPVESGLITFFLFDHPRDEAATLEDHLAAQVNKTMKDPIIKYFTNWGNYKGHGAMLKGPNSAGMPSKLQLFVYSTEERSFLIMSIYADDYENAVLPGLHVIESSFKMKQ